jgi:hypothetical protein
MDLKVGRPSLARRIPIVGKYATVWRLERAENPLQATFGAEP